MTILIYDDIFLKHDTGNHPENADRIVVVKDHLAKSGVWERCVQLPARDATVDEIACIHDPDYINTVKKCADAGGAMLDSDTIISTDSYRAAVRAVGAVLAAIDGVIAGAHKTAFCIVRPPGHHATPSRGMGFCLFNNIAVGAKYLQNQHCIEKVMIIDWDVHHGNGTQDAFYDDDSVFYLSIHRYPFYPGSGLTSETGEGAGEGFTVNIPLPWAIGRDVYVKSFEEETQRAAERFQPEFMLISAGFDAYKGETIGSLNLEIDDFRRLTEIPKEIADKWCEGRIVSVLEGGYNLEAMPRCVEEHLKGLGYAECESPADQKNPADGVERNNHLLDF